MRLLLLIVLVACGGDSGGGDDGPDVGMIPPEQLTDALESAQCDALVRCEEVQDRATCDAANLLDDQDQKTLIAAIADGSVTYDAAAAKRCADFIAMRDCTFAGFHVDDPCDEVFAGTVATGGACFIDLQCANGGRCNQTDPNCDTDAACCPGTCAGSMIESQLGGPCDDGMHVCTFDTYCSNNTCAALVATEGAACLELDACAGTMYCSVASGTCKVPAASGAPCMRTDTLPCSDSRDYCDPTTNTCTRGAMPGQSCANGVQCVDWAKCVGNQCVADRKLGESCMTAPNAADCAGTLECTNGTCSAPPAGMTCML